MRINKLLGAVVLSLAITGVPAAAVAAERTEGDKFANDYGYGTPSETVAAAERTEGDKFANNYGYGTPSETIAAVERTESDKFANNYGYGTPSDLLVDRGQR
ncbi:MAG TPA: hypothetical protein VE889_01610, partial [Actinomycetota bacterium]|nr:hypothetical protein [Actinomycetota bacterium]